MFDHLRRIVLVVAIFFSAGWLYYQWKVRHGGDGLFERIEFGQPTPAPEKFTPPTGSRLAPADVAGLARLSEESANLAGAVLPAVVSINTATLSRVAVRDMFGFLRGYRSGVTPGLGSGVIVSKEGHVITNHHVIKDADQIQVTTNDRKAYRAEVIGSDPQLDIAVLRIIGGEKDFTALNFANSDGARAGHIVFAVGNPFGFTGTVTQGIISATQRRFSDASNDLIQTDTVINPGNSGGPLVNVMGEIIGINVAIYTGGAPTHQSWQGVGLAVPSNDVKTAFHKILGQGPPVAGYVGIEINPEPVSVDSRFGTALGALVDTVAPGSPAALAGLREGDVILQFAGRGLTSLDELMVLIAKTRPGQQIPIVVVRAGRIVTLTARIVPRPSSN